MIRWKWARRGAWVGLLIGLLTTLGVFEGWERLGYDARSFMCAKLCDRPADLPVTVVLIDDASLAAIGRWPWSRETLAALVRNISQHGPAAVGLDIILSEPAPGDMTLAAALPTGRVVLPAYAQDGRNVAAVPVLAQQGASGHIEVSVDRDGVVRSVPGVREGRPPFGIMAAQMLTRRPYTALPERFWLDLRLKKGAGQLGLDTLADTVSAADVMAGRVQRALFAGRLVFVGIGATGAAGIDAHVTPLRPLGAVPGVYIHAGLAAAEITGSHMRRPGRFLELLLALAAGLAAGLLLAVGAPKGADSTESTQGADGSEVTQGTKSAESRRRSWLTSSVPSAVALSLVYSGFVLIGHAEAIWLPWVAPMLALIGTVAWAATEKRLAQEWERQLLRRLFSRYVPPEVLPELLQRSSELGLAGVQRDIAVLFVDVRGFTALAEPLLPVQVMQVLNLYLEAMAASVRQHGGMVDKYLGDGLMAVFGAPVPLADAAQAAVSCALDMHVRVSQLMPPPCVRALPAIGVGIHIGDAILGTVGGRERLEYTAMGDVVNVAARLEEMAPAGSVLLSGDVMDRLAESRLQSMCKPLGVQQVRGKRQQVAVYEIPCLMDLEGDAVFRAMDGLAGL